jgi:hypothetical protein
MFCAGGRHVFECLHRIGVIADGGLVRGEAHRDGQRRVDRIGDVTEHAPDWDPGTQAVHRDLGGAGELAEIVA